MDLMMLVGPCSPCCEMLACIEYRIHDVFLPSMAHTNDMINITQCEFEQFIGQNGSSICKAEQRMIGEHSAQAHCPGMENSFMAEVTQTRMTMYYLDLLPYDDIAKDGKERENGGEGRLPVYHEKGNMIDFQSIRKIANTSPTFISMSDNDDFMPAIYEFLVTVNIQTGKLTFVDCLLRITGICGFQLRLSW